MAYTLSVLKGATAILTRVFLSVILLIIKKIRDARTFDKQTIRSVPFGLPTTKVIFNLETYFQVQCYVSTFEVSNICFQVNYYLYHSQQVIIFST